MLAKRQRSLLSFIWGEQWYLARQKQSQIPQNDGYDPLLLPKILDEFVWTMMSCVNTPTW